MQFDGLEAKANTLGSDPVMPLHRPGMKLCVNVLAAGRPNYLYVALDSLFRNTVFQDGSHNVPDVFLYVDRLSTGQSYAGEILKVASEFPLDAIFINKQHKGTVANYWASFDRAFADGYDMCVLLEEDWLITTNALQWLYDVPKIGTHYSLYRWTDRMDTPAPGDEWPERSREYSDFAVDEEFHGVKFTRFRHGLYLSWCLAFEADGYKFIRQIMKANGHWGITKELDWDPSPPGRRNVPIKELRRTSYIDWDRIIIPILDHYGMLSIAPSVPYLAHFGSQTCNYRGYGSGVNVHDQIFTGPRESWLNKVAEVFRTTSTDEKHELHLYPLTFEYM